MSNEARYIELLRLTDENKRLQNKIDNLVHVIDQHAQAHTESIMLMEQMRAQGALMVHALDRAVALNEALFSFWPPDVPMNPNVSACKAQYNEAMEKVFQRRVGADRD